MMTTWLKIFSTSWNDEKKRKNKWDQRSTQTEFIFSCTITNYHKGKQPKFIILLSVDQKFDKGLTGLKLRHQQDIISFWRLQRKIISLTFPASRGLPYPLAPSPHLPSSQSVTASWVPRSHHSDLFFWPLIQFWRLSWLHWAHPYNLPISRSLVKSHL